MKKGIIRQVLLVVDCSRSMGEKDMFPTRLDFTGKTVKDFISEFFDQNPIGNLGVLMTKNSVANKVSDLSGMV